MARSDGLGFEMIKKVDKRGHPRGNLALLVEDIKQERPMGIELSGIWSGGAGLV
jgi:hypothetical protein